MIGNSLKVFLSSDLPPSYSEVMLDPCKFPSYLPSMTPPPPPYAFVKEPSFPRVLSMITPETITEDDPPPAQTSPPDYLTAALLLTLGGMGGLVLPQVVVGVLDISCDNNATSTWLLVSSVIWLVILILGSILIIIANFDYMSEFFIISNMVLFFLWVYGCCTIYNASMEDCEGWACSCPMSFYLAWGYVLVQGLLYCVVLVGLLVMCSLHSGN